ncbi:ferredoxin--NADP reductase [Chitinophagaceae bacterium MMS25-I14]
MLQPWQQGVVTRIEQESHNTRRYWIKLPESETFPFKAGQFVTLDLPIHEQRNKRWRSYSIASMPDGNNEIELLISLVEGGAGSTYIFNDVKEGSEFTLRGPQGVFVLPEHIDRDIFFVCTGTGIAPFRSMLHYIHRFQLHHEGLHLIFGCRTRKDLLYAHEMQELEKMIPGFKYHPTLSREEWDGHKGYVHSIYEALCEDRKPAHFMLCGWRAMIDEAKQKITGMGYDKKDIHLELYG